MRVLVACEYSGRTREAFRARGHDAVSCDLLESEDNSPHHIIGDVLELAALDGWDLMIAHPPCTYLANSGVRWLYKTGMQAVRDEERWRNMHDAAQFFARLLAAPIPKIAIENPVMHRHGRQAINVAARKLGVKENIQPRFVQPWWFGDPFFKATGFTLKGLPPLTKPATALTPPKRGTPKHKEWSAIHMASPGPDRWKERSRTFPGVARAMAEAWG